MENRTDFKQNAEITLTDGTEITLDQYDFTLFNNSVTDSAGAMTLPLGVAICRSIKMELMNDDDRYENTEFFGATIRLYLTFKLSDTTEKVELGRFTVNVPETYGDTVIITAVDDMYKADKPYSTNLIFPVSARSMLQEACTKCGIALGSASFQNETFQVQQAPTGTLTYRQVIGYIAMLACGNARINRSGYLEVISYNFGGSAQTLANWKNLKTDANDITITGVQTTRTIEVEGGTGTETVASGTEGYVIAIDNPLAIGKEEELVSYLGGTLINATFRRFEGDHIAYPLVEFMDLVDVVDRKGNVYRSVATDINFVFFGFTTIRNSAETALRRGSMFATPTSKAIVAAQKLVEKEATEREIAIRQLNERVQNASGMFSTEEIQPDGSTILFIHDKPTIEESRNVIKVTAEGTAISNDGGETYNYGVTVDGDAIMRVIQAVGINAEWVKVKETAEDGERQIDLQASIDGLKSNISETQTDINDLGASTSEQITQVLQTSESIILSALKDYVETSDYEAYKTAVSSQFKVLSDQIEINLTTSLDKAGEINGALQEQINQITTYFRFTEDGQYIGRSDSAMQTHFANALWEFVYNGIRQLYVDPYGVHGRQIHTDAIYIGNLSIVERDDGSVVIS